jgi:hypothetical protein
MRFLEFFGTNIRNPHARRANYRYLGFPPVSSAAAHWKRPRRWRTMPRRARRYDRRRDEVSLDEVERIVI